jgi:5'-nucleotidase
MGRRHFWLTVEPIEEVEEASDRWAVERGLVSITPLRLDLTDGAQLARLRKEHPLQGDAGVPDAPVAAS